MEGIKTQNNNIIFIIIFLELVLDTIHNNSSPGTFVTSNKWHNHDEIWNNANSVLKWCFAAVAIMVA